MRHWFYTSPWDAVNKKRVTKIYRWSGNHSISLWLNLGDTPEWMAQQLCEGLEARDKAIRLKQREDNRKAKEQEETNEGN